MSEFALGQTVRRLSWVDVVLIGPMAIPGVSHLIMALIGWLDSVLGLNSAVTQVNAMGMLFMNVVGVLAVSWCVVRIKAPSLLLARVDVAARLVISMLIILYIGLWGVSALLLIFLISEMLGAAVEGKAIYAAES